MQFIAIISTITAILCAIMNYNNTIQINLLSSKAAHLTGLSIHTIHFDLAIYTTAIFILGAISVLCFIMPLYNSLKNKYSAYKKELEKGSITNTSSEAKINVLENKITVLEKALDEALKKRS